MQYFVNFYFKGWLAYLKMINLHSDHRYRACSQGSEKQQQAFVWGMPLSGSSDLEECIQHTQMHLHLTVT